MARKPRLFVPGATYHVYCRVARGEFVFDDPYEAEEFVEKVREVRETDDWRILAWCLMGNHYHLVIKTGSIPLWRSMLRLQSGIARGFNKRRRYLGRWVRWVPLITTSQLSQVTMGATFTNTQLFLQYRCQMG